MIRRHTVQCALVYETVNKLHCHATADEIYDAIVKEHPNVSRGTVYRNLNRLSEMGKIRKLELPGKADRFDHRCEQHYHVKCQVCGRIFDVDMDCMPDLEKNIRSPHGFTFTGHDIFFRGICPDCQSRKPEESSASAKTAAHTGA